MIMFRVSMFGLKIVDAQSKHCHGIINSAEINHERTEVQYTDRWLLVQAALKPKIALASDCERQLVWPLNTTSNTVSESSNKANETH